MGDSSTYFNQISSNSSSIENNKSNIYCEKQNFASKEAFKKLRTNLLLSLNDVDHCKIVGVTSAQPSEGKSTVSVNLAYSLAETGKKVMLIDCDMRKSSLHTKLGLNMSPGLSELMQQTSEIGSSVQRYISDGPNVAFDVICGGKVPSNPAELLNSKRMTSLLNALVSAYDYIVMDFPPVDAVVDAVSAGQNTDGMIVVLREGNCPVKLLDDCIEQLKYAKIKILGFVVNGSKEGLKKKYQYGYYK